MGSETDRVDAGRTQRTYARLAGFLFLGVILFALCGGLILSHVAGNGTDAETAERIAASEHLYRVGLSIAMMTSLGSALLAFALYATLKTFNSLLAQLAMIFSLGDSFLALIVRMCGFVRLHLSASAHRAEGGTPPAQALAELMRSIASTTENIGGICFGIGMLLFFYLFFQSRYIPRTLSTVGLCASVIWITLYFANLVFPEYHSQFQNLCLPLMAVADVATGIYLMCFAVRTETPRHS